MVFCLERDDCGYTNEHAAGLMGTWRQCYMWNEVEAPGYTYEGAASGNPMPTVNGLLVSRWGVHGRSCVGLKATLCIYGFTGGLMRRWVIRKGQRSW